MPAIFFQDKIDSSICSTAASFSHPITLSPVCLANKLFELPPADGTKSLDTGGNPILEKQESNSCQDYIDPPWKQGQIIKDCFASPCHRYMSLPNLFAINRAFVRVKTTPHRLLGRCYTTACIIIPCTLFVANPINRQGFFQIFFGNRGLWRFRKFWSHCGCLLYWFGIL